MTQNKYHQILRRILSDGKRQTGRKGEIVYLVNERLSLSPADLLENSKDTESPGRSSGRN